MCLRSTQEARVRRERNGTREVTGWDTQGLEGHSEDWFYSM